LRKKAEELKKKMQKEVLYNTADTKTISNVKMGSFDWRKIPR
jgi:hypothetical protein